MLTNFLALIARLSLSIEWQLLCAIKRGLFKPYQPHKQNINVHHIVVYRVGNFGDTLLVIPALKAIRETFPDSTITLLTSSGNPNYVSAKDVLAAFPDYADKIIQYLPKDIKTLSGFSKIKNDILQSGTVDLFIDLPVTMQTLKRNLQELFLAKNLNARFAIGFNQIFPSILKTPFTKAYPHKIPKTSDWFTNTLNTYNITSTHNTEITLNNNPDRLKNFQQKFSTLNPSFSITEGYVVVCAGAKLAIKQWSVSSFITVLKTILKEHPHLKVILVGAPQEKELNQAIETGIMDNRIINFCGHTTLEESMILVQHAQTVLSNDTGTMHVAGVLNIPTVTPLSGQFPNPLWHPVGSNYQLLQAPVPCAPCFYEQCPLAEQQCMTHISTEDVSKAVLKQIQTK